MPGKMSGMEAFLAELEPHLKGVKAMVSIRMRGTGYAEDVMQETLLAAWRHCSEVSSSESLRPWLFQIARNKCNDHYRRFGRETACDPNVIYAGVGHHGRTAAQDTNNDLRDVREALDDLTAPVREVVSLHYQMGYSIREAAEWLNVPEGTVKRRLHVGRNRLRTILNGEETIWKGYDTMIPTNAIPKFRPDITITRSAEPPFVIDCPEALWMYESLNLGEIIWFGLFDAPDWRLTSLSRAKTTRKAHIHDIEAVEVEFSDWDHLDSTKVAESHRTVYLAELDGEVKTLAATWEEDGKPYIKSYLDSGFNDNWNSGVKKLLKDEGRFIQAVDNVFQTVDSTLSIGAGRFTVKIGGKEFDCLRVLDAQEGALLEGFLLKNGHVLMGRRYNECMWKIGEGQQYGLQPWDERFPNHLRIVIDGVTYIHWYDSISEAAFK